METQNRRMNGTQWVQATVAFGYVAEDLWLDAGEVIEVDSRIARELIQAGLAKRYEGDPE